MIRVNLHNQFTSQLLLYSSSLCRWETRGSERLGHLPQITWLLTARAKIQMQAVQFWVILCPPVAPKLSRRNSSPWLWRVQCGTQGPAVSVHRAWQLWVSWPRGKLNILHCLLILTVSRSTGGRGKNGGQEELRLTETRRSRDTVSNPCAKWTELLEEAVLFTQRVDWTQRYARSGSLLSCHHLDGKSLKGLD